jgi:hypothetical protein
MFRPLLDHHQVSVSVKLLNLYLISIHIMGLSVYYNILTSNWLYNDASSSAQLLFKQ